MANPTLKNNSEQMDFSGLAIKCDQVIVNGSPIGAVASSLITDASVAHALAATFSDVEVETALDAIGTKINAILDILEAHGLMSAS